MTADDLPAAFDTVPREWRRLLPGWTAAAQGEVTERVRAVSGTRPIGPPDPFRALRMCPPSTVRVVLLGQDPYPGVDIADGLAFSANAGRPVSLRRVFDILEADRPGYIRPQDGRLDRWAQQGVLLLNPTLTIELGVIGSHVNCGWQALTSEIVSSLCRLPQPPVFLLWGRHAQAFFDGIGVDGPGVRALRSRHPSNDFKRQFMADGSHFMATRQWVDWWVE